jgi:hypothetical protein
MAWIVAVWVSFAELCAQTAERLPAFEVVSIRPSGANSRTRGIYTFPGGRVTGENRTLSDLIEEAFDLQRFQVLGGEKWVHEDRYDFDASLRNRRNRARRTHLQSSFLPTKNNAGCLEQCCWIDFS